MVTQLATCDQFVGHDGHIYSNAKLNEFGSRQCIPFRENILAKYYSIAPILRAEYLSIANKESYVNANRKFLELDKALHVRNLNLLSNEENVSEFSIEQAQDCTLVKASVIESERAYSICCTKAYSYRISPPNLEDYDYNVEACLNRLCCEKWWKRQVKKLRNTTIESILRELRQVHNFRTPYCSNFSLKRHQAQKKNNREYLESQIAVNQDEQEFTLAELSDLGVSNPRIRRVELITRCKGFEAVAKSDAFKHDAIFLTLTTPSRFHRMTKITNREKIVKVIPNGKYENLSPRDAQNYLTNLWGKIQAKLGRERIKPYGFRVAEPHHDGTPHWHFLLFVNPLHTSQLITIFKQWSLMDSPNEKGAFEHRLKVEHIKSGVNPENGKKYSATGYLIKYICKNIDGHGINNSEKTASGKDWAGKNPYETAERIEAWARTYRIRQFQQIGGPSVTVWRELRRLSEQEGALEKIREAADGNDWAAFTLAMGGPALKRKDYNLAPAYSHSQRLDRETGEIIPILHTSYGDDAKERVVGILFAGITVLSRTHFWEIKENEKIVSARRKIMNGVIELLEEVHLQNQLEKIPTELLFSQQAPPVALDLCQ